MKAALERLDGVKTVKLSKKNMKWFGELTMNDGKALDEETIKKAVADVAKKDGKDYKVTSFKALKAAPEVKEEKKDAKPDAGDAPKTEEKKDDKAAK